MMLHHVSVGVKDVERAGRFYDAVLATLGFRRVMDFSPGAVAYGAKPDMPQFWVGLPHNQQPHEAGNGQHIAFVATAKAAIHKFYETALTHGGTDNGAPGARPEYGPDYYGAFVCDLDGNRIEAVLVQMPRAASAKPAKPVKAQAKKKMTKKASAKKTVAKKAKTVAKKAAGKPTKKAKRKARKR